MLSRMIAYKSCSGREHSDVSDLAANSDLDQASFSVQLCLCVTIQGKQF